ncbi:TRAP transporter large permease subunit [Iocasia frigidifontis]|uniref:TRAP transporter large permease subunit n=1 Tax=Iocasia fonsfrigidae TaxID=2682810 RepID=A0A8A7K6Q0_9FIRM|nr:TRAP transporter large permease [Iocasia fonsfrigidae]QTL96850.1 TRAP transporter large permease subunit [Iocasia fonsfrigidae]
MLILVLVIMAVGFIIGLPVAFTLGSAALAYFLADPFLPNVMVPMRLVVGAQSHGLMAIPLYMLAGNLMNSTGLTDRIFRFTKALVGHFAGGTAYVNIIASFIFSGMSGSELADASGLGSVLIPSMVDEGYDCEFSTAVTAASSTIGPIFPPSIPLVLIGGVTGISVGRLFMGGVVPGILLAIYMMVLVYFISKKRNYPKNTGFSGKELFKSFIHAFPALTTPVVIIGGILGGFFTPTEAGVVAVVYALFIAGVVYRDIKSFSIIFEQLVKTAIYSAKIMFIVGSAYALAWVLARVQVGSILTNYLTDVSTNPLIVLSIICLAFLLFGCFLNPSAIIIIFVPLLMPVINAVGIDPVHFGVVATLVLMIGLATPPFGLAMFIVCDIGNLSIGKFTKGMIPFYIALIVAVITMILIPQVVTYVPNVFFG